MNEKTNDILLNELYFNAATMHVCQSHEHYLSCNYCCEMVSGTERV